MAAASEWVCTRIGLHICVVVLKNAKQCKYCCSIFLYADDILLLAPTVSALQIILRACEDELENLDMQLNVAKSICLRIGPRVDKFCVTIQSKDNRALDWETGCSYLGE